MRPFQTSVRPLLTALGLAAATMIGLRLALAHRKQIPDRSLTLQSLVWWREPAPGEITSRPTIAAKVREIVVEQLGVEPSQVVEGARFVEDLGIG